MDENIDLTDLVFIESRGIVVYTVIVPAAAPIKKVIAVGSCSPGRVEPCTIDYVKVAVSRKG